MKSVNFKLDLLYILCEIIDRNMVGVNLKECSLFMGRDGLVEIRGETKI